MSSLSTVPVSEHWTPHTWLGNPEMRLIAAYKHFSPPSGQKVPVWVFGNGTEEFYFCVSAGASSDYSYTGLCVDCYTLESAQAYVDNKGQQLFK